MNFGSLFAGIGGFDLGFERAGMRCAWQVEIDDRCNQVLAHHWPGVERYGDIHDVGQWNLETVDLIAGGFPCQDLSIAGCRDGLDGERSGLWFEFLRVVEELEPRWVVIENVPGLLSSWGGDAPPSDLRQGREWQTTEESDMAIVHRGLAERGYMGAYRVLNAEFWGVPQRRRRVFVVGCLGDWIGPAEVLFERESSPWDSAPSREAGARTTQAITGRLGGGGPDDNKAQGGFYVAHEIHGGSKRKDRPKGGFYVREMPTSKPLDTGGLNPNCQQGEIDTATACNAHGSGRYDFESETFVMAVSENQRAELRLTPYSRQLTSGGGKPGQGYPCITQVYPTLRGQPNQGPGRMADDSARAGLVRRLTPLECERLQGFPDYFTAVNGMSDSARYRMLGNAVAVPVAEWLGRRIMSAAVNQDPNGR